jgi:hypothetical protein
MDNTKFINHRLYISVASLSSSTTLSGEELMLAVKEKKVRFSEVDGQTFVDFTDLIKWLSKRKGEKQ